MASNNPLKALSALAFLAGLAIPANASVARAIAFEQKVDLADAIVVGKCTSTRSAWDPSGRWIVTYSTFAVEKALKGASVPEVTVVTPGGAVNGIRQETVGVPHFERGDQNVLFVKRDAIGPTVLYLDQGAYEITRDERGEPTVAPVSSSLVLMDTQTGRVSAAESPRSLQRFERDVRERLQRVPSVQQYGVTPEAKRPAKSARAEFVDFLKTYRLMIAFALIAIAITSYLLIKGR